VKMIRLTEVTFGETPVLISVERICAVSVDHSSGDGRNRIFLDDGSSCTVRETIDEIQHLIEVINAQT
jgi:hypothetical protein